MVEEGKKCNLNWKQHANMMQENWLPILAYLDNKKNGEKREDPEIDGKTSFIKFLNIRAAILNAENVSEIWQPESHTIAASFTENACLNRILLQCGIVDRGIYCTTTKAYVVTRRLN
jgi:hypothetical protein